MPTDIAPPPTEVLTWERLCTDLAFAYLQDIPGTVETNEHGQILVSPTRFAHGLFQKRIASLLDDLVAEPGESVTEPAIETRKGTKVADVGWFDAAHVAEMRDRFSAEHAPAICVEVLSPYNTTAEIDLKARLYFEGGAREVWICDVEGRLRFFTEAGEIDASGLAPAFPRRVDG